MKKFLLPIKDIILELIRSRNDGKKWYTSKTLWANVVLIVSILLQMKLGFLIEPEIQALVVTLINIVLRKITKQPLSW